MRILITGAKGFIGRNLAVVLRLRKDVTVFEYDLDSTAADLHSWLGQADVIYHLAGVNRPQEVSEFQAGNRDFTASLCGNLMHLERHPLLVFASSIQAAMDNPYGVSKRQAEDVLKDYAAHAGAPVVVFRFKNVFGKWCKPNYNSVTATFAHNIAHDLPITISDPRRELELVYIDDVVASLIGVLEAPPHPGTFEYREVPKVFKITLGEMAETLQSLRQSRQTLMLPGLEDPFTRNLYATYLSYLDGPDFAYPLEQKTDERGSLAEFIKSAGFGQIFVSRTRPGITRGNHYHHTKAEKFLVLEGEAIIRFRSIVGTEVVEHRVCGRDFKVVDIPPGYTHSITNVGTTEVIVLFWASEIFDPARADTYFEKVTDTL